jgi:hypothetical protein
LIYVFSLGNVLIGLFSLERVLLDVLNNTLISTKQTTTSHLKPLNKYIKIFFQTKQQQQQQLNTSINIFAKLNTTINKKKYFQTKNINKYPLQKIIKKTKNN